MEEVGRQCISLQALTSRLCSLFVHSQEHYQILWTSPYWTALMGQSQGWLEEKSVMGRCVFRLDPRPQGKIRKRNLFDVLWKWLSRVALFLLFLEFVLVKFSSLEYLPERLEGVDIISSSREACNTARSRHGCLQN